MNEIHDLRDYCSVRKKYTVIQIQPSWLSSLCPRSRVWARYYAEHSKNTIYIHKAMLRYISSVLIATLSIPFALAHAATLEVGDGKSFQRIEDAVLQAKSGDEIVVHAKDDGSPYRQPVLLVSTSKLTIRAADPKKNVVLDGDGFVYSGRGSLPRAIVQFDPTANGCTLDGFKLINARNESFNGAGVRINQASDIIIRNCEIRDNDMGIMSNGDSAKQTGSRQLIEKCKITDNGTTKDPGYNHNLYLGGTSVTVKNCEIARAVTGSNLKSRAHLNYIIGNHIHYSANRELDLVDAVGTTDVPGSDSFLIGNTIVKDPKCNGNKAVVHFGRDGKAVHDGTIWLVGNTIRTPFVSPVVVVSSGLGVVFIDNVIDDDNAKQKGALVSLRDPRATASGKGNTIPERFAVHLPNDEEKLPTELDAPPELPNDIKNLKEIQARP